VVCAHVIEKKMVYCVYEVGKLKKEVFIRKDCAGDGEI